MAMAGPHLLPKGLQCGFLTRSTLTFNATSCAVVYKPHWWLLSWVAFRIIGLENAMFWAVVAGVLHTVP